MEGARIRLSSSTDKLVWEYNRSEGSVTAELVYDSIIFSSSSLIGFPLQALILSGILPKKIRCSVWLALANKIRTWENLQKRGWIGPGCCALCGNGEDCVQHLFSSCFMQKNAIIYLSDVYHFLPPQHSDKLSTFLSTWISRFPKHSLCCYLPFFTIWVVWKERNNAIFEGNNPSLMSITQQVMYLSQLYKPAVAKVEKPRAIGLEPVLVPPYGFFDGAATEGIGGVGFCLYLKVSHSFEFAMGAGTCTNTKAELIALWALLHVTLSMGIPKLNIFCDSEVIINATF